MKGSEKERKFDLTTPLDMVRFVFINPVSFPGSYDHILITKEGNLICPKCLNENYKSIFRSTEKEEYDGVTGITNESELEDVYCDICNESIGYVNEEEGELIKWKMIQYFQNFGKIL